MGFGDFAKDMFKGSGGSIVSGALGAIGGFLGNSSQESMFSQAQALSREQFEYQKALHQNQIQWRVQDALKAGVHPMAALGLSSMSFSPVSSSSMPGYDNWLGEIGQNVDRAIQQGKSAEERKQAQALQDRLMNIQIRKGEADADLAETEASAARYRLQREMFPAPPPVNSPVGLISGQGDSLTITNPSTLDSAIQRGVQAGAPASVRWMSNPDNSVSRVMSEKAKDATEDDLLNTIGWHIDNNLVPFAVNRGFDVPVNPAAYAPPLEYLPKGAVGWLPDGVNRFVPVYSYNIPGAFYGDLD